MNERIILVNYRGNRMRLFDLPDGKYRAIVKTRTAGVDANFGYNGFTLRQIDGKVRGLQNIPLNISEISIFPFIPTVEAKV